MTSVISIRKMDIVIVTKKSANKKLNYTCTLWEIGVIENYVL